MATYRPTTGKRDYSMSGVPIMWQRGYRTLDAALAGVRRSDPLSASRGLLIGLIVAALLWVAFAALIGVI